jgi:hypothetical protein
MDIMLEFLDLAREKLRRGAKAAGDRRRAATSARRPDVPGEKLESSGFVMRLRALRSGSRTK